MQSSGRCVEPLGWEPAAVYPPPQAQAFASRMNVIESARLSLRELVSQDAEFILALLNEPGFRRFIGDKGVRTVADARDYIVKGPVESYRRHGFGLYLTSLRRCGTPIGICGLVKREALADVDVGFAFLSAYWANGYASESAAAVLAYGRETLSIKRIVAITATDNHGSIAVVGKLGLRLEGTVRLAADGPDLYLFGPPA
jgi:RimJ/RimL family protein N-acetyltransferase